MNGLEKFIFISFWLPAEVCRVKWTQLLCELLFVLFPARWISNSVQLFWSSATAICVWYFDRCSHCFFLGTGEFSCRVITCKTLWVSWHLNQPIVLQSLHHALALGMNHPFTSALSFVLYDAFCSSLYSIWLVNACGVLRFFVYCHWCDTAGCVHIVSTNHSRICVCGQL